MFGASISGGDLKPSGGTTSGIDLLPAQPSPPIVFPLLRTRKVREKAERETAGNKVEACPRGQKKMRARSSRAFAARRLDCFVAARREAERPVRRTRQAL